MDTKTLIAEAKARFSHNSAKDYLREKYNSKLTVAVQNGLWKADAETINILNTFKTKKLILIDTFGNPVEVDRVELLETLKELYATVMKEWYKETKELEAKR
jgi:hypothetical protein